MIVMGPLQVYILVCEWENVYYLLIYYRKKIIIMHAHRLYHVKLYYIYSFVVMGVLQQGRIYDYDYTSVALVLN